MERATTRCSALLAALLLAAMAAGAEEEWDPVPDPRAVVRCGTARFTVLADRLVRMEQSPDGRFDDLASLVFVNRRLPVPAFTVTRTGAGCVIDTGRLRLAYAGGAFAPETLSAEGEGFRWRYGDADRGNLLGSARTLDTVGDRSRILDIIEKGILSRDGWAVVDDTRGHRFRGTDDHWRRWVEPRAATGTDLYLFGYGHDYKAALGDYVKVAGRIPLPPKWAFGYWWSRYWPYSDNELEEIADAFDARGIPMDVLVIDMDWHETWGLGRGGGMDEFGQKNGWTGYTWKKLLFPNPRAFLKRLHDRGLKVPLEIHPASGVQPMEDCYVRFCAAYGWTGTNAVPYRLCERKWADCWYDQVLKPLEADGVDFWWIDWQQWLTSKYMPGLSCTFWLNHTMAQHESEKRDAAGRPLRPLIYHRWGGLGSHRYPVGFSGDTLVRWKMLAALPWFTATSGNVGCGYWGHDTGGHMDPNGLGREPEIFTRWLQSAVFTPVFRTHCSNNPELERRIWMYPDHFETMREAFRLRYRLAPYVYTAARACFDTGVSICRPLYWDEPEKDVSYDPTLAELRFGDDIVAATATEPTDAETGLARVRVALPDGVWYDAATGETLAGGRVLFRRYTIDETPWFVRAGAILPMNPPDVRRLGSFDGSRQELFVAPGAPSGRGTLYEDDGTTAEYPDRFARTDFSFAATNAQLALEIGARRGTYAGQPAKRSWTVRLANRLPPASVTVDGRPSAWTYDGTLPGVVVTTPETDPARPCRIVLSFAEDVAAGERLLSGVRRLARRARRLSPEMKAAVEAAAPMAMPPDEWLSFASLASRLSEFPADAARIVSGLSAEKAAFPRRFAATAKLIPSGLVRKVSAWILDDAPFAPASALTPTDLRVDHGDGSAARPRPVFSWALVTDRRGATQSACRVRVRADGGAELWDSGVVYTDEKGGLRYGGRPLDPGARCRWEVSVADELGVFSEPVAGTFAVAGAGRDAAPRLDGDGELGYERIKRVWRFWRETGDKTVIADSWKDLCASPVFTSAAKTLRDDLRAIRAGWLMKEMGNAAFGEAEGFRFYDFEDAARIRFASRWQNADTTLRDEVFSAANAIGALKARVIRTPEARAATARRLRGLLAREGVPPSAGRFEPEETFVALTEDAGLGDETWALVEKGGYDPVLSAAAADWRRTHGAGIREYWARTGYVMFTLAPVFAAGVPGASAAFDSPAGRIASEWTRTADGKIVWRFTVPAGSAAQVRLPDGSMREYPDGEHVVRW